MPYSLFIAIETTSGSISTGSSKNSINQDINELKTQTNETIQIRIAILNQDGNIINEFITILN